MVDLRSKNWRELIKPKRIEIAQDSYTNYYGKFICEPLGVAAVVAVVVVHAGVVFYCCFCYCL